MNLLILVIAMGVIGVIGTVEYSHAQTVLTIPSTNLPEPKIHQSIAIQTVSTSFNTSSISVPINVNNWLFTTPTNITIYVRPNEGGIGHIFMPGPYAEILSNPLLPKQTEIIQYCNYSPESVKFLLTEDIDKVKGLKIPNNIKEQTNDTIIAMGFNWIPSKPADTYKCPIDLEAPTKYPIITKNELRYTLYNQSDNKAYYFSPRENILQAQPIPLCTSDNFDITDQTLKGDTKMCYGKNSNDMIIISKKLTGFYGATEEITTPTIKRNLDSVIVDNPDYLALLERLYLPPI